ncbi:MAG: histidine kinase, partial [Paenibacillus sp. RIFOXYA1_FULL_44_5]
MDNLHFVIIDDDAVSRRMLQHIVEDSQLGEVVNTFENGLAAFSYIMEEQPDLILIDLLMPDEDGIETVERLKKEGYQGKFVMISQVTNKEMVGEAYRSGIEFYIHKPINRMEVHSVLTKINDQLRIERSLQAIKKSLSGLDASPLQNKNVHQENSTRDVVIQILHEIGIAGESGVEDINEIITFLLKKKDIKTFPPLKILYEAAAARKVEDIKKIPREIKAIEQRLRRTIMAALSNLA